MTVANDKFFSDWYAANGVNKNWGFDFIIQLSTDAYIEVRNDTTQEIVVAETGFSVSWASADLSTGYVIYPSSGPAVAAGYSVRVVRDVPYTQGTQIGKEGSFDPSLHERTFDRLTMMIQQVKSATDRALKVPLGSLGYSIGNVEEGRTLIRQGSSFVAGPSAANVAAAEQNALDAIEAKNLAEAYRDEAEESAASINPAAIMEAIAAKVAKAGDVMTAALKLPKLIVAGAVGAYRIVEFQTGNSPRWQVQANEEAESGSNAGSNFAISRFADNGDYIDNPFSIRRSSGVTTVSSIRLGNKATSADITSGVADKFPDALAVKDAIAASAPALFTTEFTPVIGSVQQNGPKPMMITARRSGVVGVGNGAMVASIGTGPTSTSVTTKAQNEFTYSAGSGGTNYSSGNSVTYIVPPMAYYLISGSGTGGTTSAVAVV